MRPFMQRVSRFVRSEDGPTAIEYAVMLALILLVCLVSIRTVGTQTFNSLTKSANSIAS